MPFITIFLFVSSVLALDTIQYGAFVQSGTYSVANQLGIYTHYDLDVVYQQVPNSTVSNQQILNGGYDIGSTAIDNAVNLRFNSDANITVLGQQDQGSDLVLASIPGITDISQLEGKPLMVDSPLSGFSYVLRRVLKENNLTLENGDYFFQTVGGTNQRYDALVAGQLPNGSAVYGTILTYPVVVQSQLLPPEQRPNILARISDYVNPYSSSIFATRESNIEDETVAEKITRFLAATYTANRLLNDPRGRDCSIAAIASQLNVSREVAALEYESATNPDSGEVSPDGKLTVNREGVLNVIEIRDEFGGFPSLPPDYDFEEQIEPGPGKLIDYRLRDRALAMIDPTVFLGKCC